MLAWGLLVAMPSTRINNLATETKGVVMTFSRSLGIGIFLAGTAFNAAQAATILYGNLGNPYGGSFPYNYIAPLSSPFDGDGPLGQAFTTGSSSDLALSDVKIVVEASGTPTTGSFVVTLNAAGMGGAPILGTSLLTLGTVFDASLYAGANTLDFWGQGYLLDPGTVYWIVATDLLTGPVTMAPIDSESIAAWDVANDGTGTGVSSTNNYVGGNTNLVSGSNKPLLMSVEAPEPVSLAILGVGLAGLGYARSRRKQAVATA
jgi:hypothetical protein